MAYDRTQLIDDLKTLFNSDPATRDAAAEGIADALIDNHDESEVIGYLNVWADSADNEGLSVQTDYSGANTSSRIFYVENSDKNFGFSLIYAGDTNPTFDGTAFTLTSNCFHIVAHQDSLPGEAVMSIERTTNDVGVGVQSPSFRMDIQKSVINGYITSIRNLAGTSDSHVLITRGGASDQSGTTYFLLAKDNDNDNVGALRAVDGAFELINLSDISRKENIKDSEVDAIDLISRLPVREFSFKKSKGVKTADFVAQDCEHIPDMVGELDGEKVISKSALIPILVKAIQQLCDRIEKLESGG